ncbi:MAG: amidohydrolase family protein [Bdellovibrionales bacterium]
MKNNNFLGSFVFTFFCLLALPVSASTKGSQLDAHFHFISAEKAHLFADFFKGAVTAERAMQIMDNANIDQAFGLSAGYIFPTLSEAIHENNFMAEQTKFSSGRIVGFCGVWAIAEWAVSELERCKTLGLRGLKLHLRFQQFDFLNAAQLASLEALIVKAGELKMPVLIHPVTADQTSVSKLFAIMVKLKNTKFIVAHSLGTNYRLLSGLAFDYIHSRKNPRNIFLEVSASALHYAGSPEQKIYKWNVESFGKDRVIFGSDAPALDINQTRKAALKVFGASQFKQMLEQNHKALFE